MYRHIDISYFLYYLYYLGFFDYFTSLGYFRYFNYLCLQYDVILLVSSLNDCKRMLDHSRPNDIMSHAVMKST